MGRVIFMKNKMSGSGMQTMKYEKRGNQKGGFISGVFRSIGLGQRPTTARDVMHGGFISSVLSSFGLGMEQPKKNVRKMVRQVL